MNDNTENENNLEEAIPDAMASPDSEDKLQEYLDGWRRAQADYANLKRDSEAQRMEIVKYANENLLSELLPAMDHFEKALENIPQMQCMDDQQQKVLENWFNGLKAVKMYWEQAFKAIGLERIAVDGEFDAAKHEAVSKEKGGEGESGQILKVVETGWMLNGKVLRPAKVVVGE